MPIELFAMERMQSTWENLVDYDMSESGVRPLTLRELVAMGFDLDAFLDQPLGIAVGSMSTGQLWLQNSKGVVLELKAKRTGLALSLGGDAVYINFA